MISRLRQQGNLTIKTLTPVGIVELVFAEPLCDQSRHREIVALRPCFSFSL